MISDYEVITEDKKVSLQRINSYMQSSICEIVRSEIEQFNLSQAIKYSLVERDPAFNIAAMDLLFGKYLRNIPPSRPHHLLFSYFAHIPGKCTVHFLMKNTVVIMECI